jgi:hypothetical protein
MSKPEITIYGAYWCPADCRSKQFLGEHQIAYNWVDIEEDKEVERFVIRRNRGERIYGGALEADQTANCKQPNRGRNRHAD